MSELAEKPGFLAFKLGLIGFVMSGLVVAVAPLIPDIQPLFVVYAASMFSSLACLIYLQARLLLLLQR